MESFWDITPQDITDPNSLPIGRIGEASPAYLDTRLNLRLNDLLHSGYFMNLRVSNVFDVDIKYPTFTSNIWADRGTIDHQRHFMFSFGWKF